MRISLRQSASGRVPASLRVVALAACVTSASLAPRAASATVMVRRSLDEMAAQADLVVVAAVTDARAQWVDGRIYTDVHTRVDTVVRGRATAGAALVVRTPGGVVGDTGQQVAGAPALERGHRYVLFLRQTRRGTLETIGLSQGVLPVVTASNGGATVLPAVTSGLTLVDPPAGAAGGAGVGGVIPAGGIPLADLVARLRR